MLNGSMIGFQFLFFSNIEQYSYLPEAKLYIVDYGVVGDNVDMNVMVLNGIHFSTGIQIR